MKISAQEEYGLRCLVQVANLKEGESLTLPQIAEREGISQANAGKVLWLLNKAGFVHATRGTKGGYSLARPAGEIAMDEVVIALEGAIAPMDCFVGTTECGPSRLIAAGSSTADSAPPMFSLKRS